ncbi:MAG: type I 3-dehydroquinate dehydratase [Candidatus Nezhaarchaeota archaeon]|nr:type I 3-dehydroquinate dehydratase [Candidatus Nezhaarchaeota archaeon]
MKLRPRICVSIPCRRLEEAVRLIDEAKEGGADLVELRSDYLEEVRDFKPIMDHARLTGIPVIFTARPPAQGGLWRLSEELRVKLLKEAARCGPDYVDVECDVTDVNKLVEDVKQAGPQVIVSYHNFEGTPNLNALFRVLSSMRKMGCDVCKVAVLARSWRDSVLLLLFTETASKSGRVVCLSMGSYGLPTRILAPLYGSEFTYASLDPENQTAPGQIPLDKLKQVYDVLGL